MRGYMIFELEIIDEDAWARYREVAGPLMEAAGGKFIVRSEKVTPLEGSWDPAGISVVEFPSYAAAEKFYRSEAYRASLPLREQASRGRGVLVGSNI